MKRTLLLLLCLCLLACALPARAEVPEAFLPAKWRRQVTMPDGSGPFQFYAQNDPVWHNTFYEINRASTKRLFGDGGCNPTALAIVIASLVPEEELPLLLTQAAPKRDFSLCACSVNHYFCFGTYFDPAHARQPLETGQDLLLVLPLVLGDYAAGNNPTNTLHRIRSTSDGGNGGTRPTLFAPIAELYGLRTASTRSINEALAAIDRGGLVIVSCGGRGQPFSGSSGHYVVLCAYDETYLYVMDPYVREKYPNDRRRILERIEDGVLRIDRASLNRTGFNIYITFEPATPSTPPDSTLP